MMKYLILLNVLLVLSSCQKYDDTVYKYGNGFKNAVEAGSKGLACITVGTYACVGIGALTGYIDGKQEARKANVAKGNARLIKKMADKQATDQGVDVKDCSFFGLWCE